jgi:polyhydroxyalkanoate synthesis regulator phasin
VAPVAQTPDPSIQAFRDALEKSVTISREKLQEVIDDAVRRGRMTRGDGEEMLGRLVSRGREEAEGLLRQLEPLFSGVESRVKSTAKAARDRADQPLAKADRVRRKAKLPGFPISAYDQLSVPQIDNRLPELSRAQLERVRDYEIANRNRVGVLRALERRLSN